MRRSSPNRKKPIDGRCNAKTAAGYCHAYRLKGTLRCRIHGGAQEKFGARMRKLSKDAQNQLDEALDDPELMEPRRPIAILQTIMQGTALIPDDEIVARVARRDNLRGIDPMILAALTAAADKREDTTLGALLDELLEPNAADMEVARLELHDRSVRLVSTFARRQTDAIKALEWTKVIREVAIPILGEYGIAVTQVIRLFVPEEQRQAAMEAVQEAMRKVVGELAQVGDVK